MLVENVTHASLATPYPPVLVRETGYVSIWMPKAPARMLKGLGFSQKLGRNAFRVEERWLEQRPHDRVL